MPIKYCLIFIGNSIISRYNSRCVKSDLHKLLTSINSLKMKGLLFYKEYSVKIWLKNMQKKIVDCILMIVDVNIY